ncbi:ATP-binding protein [Streptomyces xanthophaeus]|uniref:ATP-binding protein n=1 Tax=Streptomyces xanthophaeus TaxID=67385 RepID=UPI002FEE4497
MTENRARRHRTMVEREAELATVDEALDQLTGPGPDSGGALLAFSGPAGLGKTTLLAEVRRRAHARACTVLAARGGEQEHSTSPASSSSPSSPAPPRRSCTPHSAAGTPSSARPSDSAPPNRAPRPTPRACATASTGC